MAIHGWWATFGQTAAIGELAEGPARSFAEIVTAGIPAVTLVEIKTDQGSSQTVVHVTVDVERPQDLAYPIRAREPIGVLFSARPLRPSVLALREAFPHTMHQNGMPSNMPYSLCVDDRPWAEGELTYTPIEFCRLIQRWLAKAARGELHDAAQPPDPVFYTTDTVLVLPITAFNAEAAAAEYAGFQHRHNPNLIITMPLAQAPQAKFSFSVLAFALPSQEMTSIRHLPLTLESLAQELEPFGLDLVEEIKRRLREWAGINAEAERRMAGRLAIVVAMPVATGAGRTSNDLRAFVTDNSAGELGVILGVLHHNNSTVGGGFVRSFAETPIAGASSQVVPAQVHLGFNRDMAASIAGRAAADRRKVVLVGAGSLGSQLGLTLAREGAFEWTVIDNDALLPHNMARHGLLAADIGTPKALALARQIGVLLGEPAVPILADVCFPRPTEQAALDEAFAAASIIIDASASVGVARKLSDLPGNARRVCAFFNPAGTSVVLLAEDQDRNVTLRDLEAQYHCLLLTEETLATHLDEGEQGVRYSGSCRSVTNRIPASRAAILSGLAARGITDVLAGTGAAILVWTLHPDGSVAVVRRDGAAMTRTAIGNWNIHYDDGLLAQLAALRNHRLPNETGGALVGITDTSRHSIHIAHAFAEPEDSRSSPSEFERGVVGLTDSLEEVARRSMHQVRYIGEWHSHPKYASAQPSPTDLVQLVFLGAELADDGLPGLMAIAADKGDFCLLSFDPTQCRPQARSQGKARHASR